MEKINLGKSEDNKWDIPAVIVTNKSISAADKQNAIITLARHGQERGARVIGPEILHYLAGDDAREIRDRQTVIVLVANPVGFVQDEFNSSMYGITGLEKKLWGDLYSAYAPDMMVDYHRGICRRKYFYSISRTTMSALIPLNKNHHTAITPTFPPISNGIHWFLE